MLEPCLPQPCFHVAGPAPEDTRLRGCARCNRREPVRFDSFRFRTFRNIIGSVRKVICSGSASGSGRFQNYTVRFGSVRPLRFGFLIFPAVNCPKPSPSAKQDPEFAGYDKGESVWLRPGLRRRLSGIGFCAWTSFPWHVHHAVPSL